MRYCVVRPVSEPDASLRLSLGRKIESAPPTTATQNATMNVLVYAAWAASGSMSDEATAPRSETRSAPSTAIPIAPASWRSRTEEHPYELQSLMRTSYARCCLTQKTKE